MRILLITGFWPTSDRPDIGSFVVDRVAGGPMKVVAPRSFRMPMPERYAALLFDSLLARGEFDGVEAHPLFPTGLIGLAIAKLRRIPLVVYAHGSDVRTTARENRVYAQLARAVVKGSSAVITNSRDTSHYIEAMGGRAEIIAPGVDLQRFRPTCRPRDGSVLYLGGTRSEKGYDVARLLATTIRGPGIRPVDPATIPILMASHDIVLVPSLEEGFGLVAAEAIASGRWVVASRVGGLPDIVQDGINGTLVSDGDFAGAIARVPDYEPETVAETARRFDLTIHQQRMDAVWRRVLSAN